MSNEVDSRRPERMPPLDHATMTEAQKRAADVLKSGPRGGVKGPFIALIRAPELMDRLQKVGEYLRFETSLDRRISEFLMLIVAREWTQQFEWHTHVPLALGAGLERATVSSLSEGRRPLGMASDEEVAFDFVTELLRSKGVSDPTYQRAVAAFSEVGIIDLLGVVGYFTTMSMVLNVARTPPSSLDDGAPRLEALPL